MACSTCGGRRLVSDPDLLVGGSYIDCPDCRPAAVFECPVHGDRVRLDGKCQTCAGEAARATLAIASGKAHNASEVAA